MMMQHLLPVAIAMIGWLDGTQAFAVAPRPPDGDYASPTGWDVAYSTGREAADWLLPYDAIRDELLTSLTGLEEDPILECGCGTSPLASRLVADGFRKVVACDASRVAIEAASSLFGEVAGLSFVHSDARSLKAFPDGAFAAVIDKGTLDAVCSGEGFDFEGGRVARALCRVLRPTGRWLCVSLMPPQVVLPMMRRDGEWALEHQRLGDGLHLYRGLRATV